MLKEPWREKYRPKSLKDCVLPLRVNEVLSGFLANQDIVNVIFSGRAGTGKTTAARALCRDLDWDVLEINASKEGNIDTIRNRVANFVAFCSSNGKKKAVIFDEADGMSIAAQEALRGFFESNSRNCSFILTCNNIGNIIEPLRASRCLVLSFDPPVEETEDLQFNVFLKIIDILKKEGVNIDEEKDHKILASLVAQQFPDFRQILVVLESGTIDNKINIGLLSTKNDGIDKAEFVKLAKSKDIQKIREWIVRNFANSASYSIYRFVYDTLFESFSKDSIPEAVIMVGRYQAMDHMAVDKEINMLAFVVDLISTCKLI
jgi:DNA polymerase III delta prime subunit